MMAEILGDRADKAAKEQTMKKLCTLKQVILEDSKRRPHSVDFKKLEIEITQKSEE